MSATRHVQGIGVGVRRQFAAALARTTRQVDFVEVTPENWLGFGGERKQQLAACLERYPTVLHSVSLNIGGLEALDEEFLAGVAALGAQVGMPFWSDHVCYSSVAGQPVSDLLPLPFSQEAVAHTAARIREVKARVPHGLALENATFYAHMPVPAGEVALSEGAFLRRILEEGDCGMLLDVNNVYVNSQNHGFDPFSFIDELPMERVWQLHVAGHTLIDDVIIDTHIGPIIDPVWALYQHTLRRAGRLIPTIVEWDQEIPALDKVLDEVDRARKLAKEALGGVVDETVMSREGAR